MKRQQWPNVGLIVLVGVFALACAGRTEAPATAPPVAAAGTAATTSADGVRLIPIHTPKGDFRVWTKRVGDNPRIKLLLLHGGPGFTHEYLEAFGDWLPAAGIEFYYYDQLGSFYSDQPDDDELWELPRFVDEVEQVRRALGLDRSNFYLYGHSWGGLLALEYALQHQEHLKGLILSDMVASVPAYNDYARTVLMPGMDPAALAEIQRLEAEGRTDDPRYMGLLVPQHYEKHILRRPAAEWPDGLNRAMEHLNTHIYTLLQGPSELGWSGKLERWDRSADLGRITVPTLTIAGRYDTMDPAHVEWMAGQMPQGRFLYCPDGSHLSMYDDARVYFEGLIAFVRDVDEG